VIKEPLILSACDPDNSRPYRRPTAIAYADAVNLERKSFTANKKRRYFIMSAGVKTVEQFALSALRTDTLYPDRRIRRRRKLAKRRVAPEAF